MLQYNIRDWYWRAADGRVFSSGRQALIAETDAGYLGFIATGQPPTPWPKDDSGQQTLASLQTVLTPYGLWVDLKACAAAKRESVALAGVTVNVAASGKAQKTVFCSTSPSAMSNLAGLASLVQLAAITADVPWVSSGTTTMLATTEVANMAPKAWLFILQTFVALSAVNQAIDAGKIQSVADVNAAAWWPSNVIP